MSAKNEVPEHPAGEALSRFVLVPVIEIAPIAVGRACRSMEGAKP